MNLSSGKPPSRLRARVMTLGLAVALGLILFLPSPFTDVEAPTLPCRYEENCHCATPGVTVRWKAAYCMSINETDDFENAGVQNCLAASEPTSVAESGACEQNDYWRTKRCRAMHEDERGFATCTRANEMIPQFIDRGAGG